MPRSDEPIEPINVPAAVDPSIDALLALKVAPSPPGWLGDLTVDAEALMRSVHDVRYWPLEATVDGEWLHFPSATKGSLTTVLLGIAHCYQPAVDPVTEACPTCDGEGCEEGCGRRPDGCEMANAGPDSHKTCRSCGGWGRRLMNPWPPASESPEATPADPTPDRLDEPDEPGDKVVDIMRALEESIAEAKEARRRKLDTDGDEGRS